jgi:adenosylcobinamide kinase/adenosylcobinamide-phosphate guanylyltransferase
MSAALPLPLPGPSTLPPLTLVLGGARSGKSRYAETMIEGAATRGLYLATGTAGDAEMAARIAAHRARREAAPGGFAWETVEEPVDVAARLTALAAPDRPILVDCLTLWLANLIGADAALAAAGAALAEATARLAGPVVLVANEVGLGIVPDNALARTFRDAAGRLNQDLAARADRVVFVAAGLPLMLKDRTVAAR